MTHSQEQNSGWIEHTGGPMPMDPKQMVEIKCRDGWTSYVPHEASHHDYFVWDGSKYDIVAYRLHTPSPSSQGEEQ